jgi:hypothetical protein
MELPLAGQIGGITIALQLGTMPMHHRKGDRPTPHRTADTLLLFDVDADPFDMNDLAAAKPACVAAMRELLPAGWCGSAGAR